MKIRTTARYVKSRAVTKLDASDRQGLIRALKTGLPVSLFDQLQGAIDVPSNTLAAVTQIAPRTLTRRKKEGRLQTDESERLLRISLLFTRAQEVLGNLENARVWFKSPKVALGGKTPLEYVDTEPGAREVEDLLGRLEHGVFS